MGAGRREQHGGPTPGKSKPTGLPRVAWLCRAPSPPAPLGAPTPGPPAAPPAASLESSPWSVCLPAEPHWSREREGWEFCVQGLPDVSLTPGQPLRALGETRSPTPIRGPSSFPTVPRTPRTRCVGNRPAQDLGGRGRAHEGTPAQPHSPARTCPHTLRVGLKGLSPPVCTAPAQAHGVWGGHRARPNQGILPRKKMLPLGHLGSLLLKDLVLEM